MNVLSLFDGMSCGQIALERAGIKVDNYFASEIDTYAIKVTQHNYKDTIQLGDIREVHYADGYLYSDYFDNVVEIDLLIGGSPCQGFSFAGNQLNFDHPESKLFFEYVRLLKETKPKYFLLENVKMKKQYQDVISSYLGVEPIEINSSLVSGQNRKRLYWTNIPNIGQPIDKKIFWGDIREHGLDKFYYSDVALAWLDKQSKIKNKKLKIWGDDENCQMIEASHYKKYSLQRFFGIEDIKGLRYISPIECERAQTIPDNYSSIVSDTQRYKMIGNGWTVDVIAHILNNIK